MRQPRTPGLLGVTGRVPLPLNGRILRYLLYSAFPLLYALLLVPSYGKQIRHYSDAVQHKQRAVALANSLPPYAGALCRDGWVSPSTGRGTCSWHHGVDLWAGQIRYEATRPLPPRPSTYWLTTGRFLVAIAVAWIVFGLVYVFCFKPTVEAPLRRVGPMPWDI